jgi:hypothetical protein
MELIIVASEDTEAEILPFDLHVYGICLTSAWSATRRMFPEQINSNMDVTGRYLGFGEITSDDIYRESLF